jgi:hypothetical protein
MRDIEMADKTTEPKIARSLSGAERQRRFRQHHKTSSIDLPEDQYRQFTAICGRKGWTFRRAVSEALYLLQAELDAEERERRIAELNQQAGRAEASPDADHETGSRLKKKGPTKQEEVEGQISFL